jgi:hypothetical protein
VAARHHGGQEEFDDVVLADDDFVQFGDEALADGIEFVEERGFAFGFGGVGDGLGQKKILMRDHVYQDIDA